MFTMYGPSNTKIFAQRVEDLLSLQQHVRLFAHVRVHRRGAAGCGVGDADGQIVITVPLPFHDVHVLARSGIDHVQIRLRQREVLGLGHRRRLERPPRRVSSTCRRCWAELLLRLVHAEDQLAVRDRLARRGVGGRVVHDGLGRENRLRRGLRGGLFRSG
jgi:hypothetical protein